MTDYDSIIVERAIPDLRAGSARLALAAMAEVAAAETGIHARLIQDPLLAQEARQSSGIGDGIALPHLKLRGIGRPHVIFARLQKPLEFAAIDGRPVDLLLLLLSPESDGPVHLRRLARLTRLMRDETLRRHLRGTDDADTLCALLSDAKARRLAA